MNSFHHTIRGPQDAPGFLIPYEGGFLVATRYHLLWLPEDAPHVSPEVRELVKLAGILDSRTLTARAFDVKAGKFLPYRCRKWRSLDPSSEAPNVDVVGEWLVKFAWYPQRAREVPPAQMVCLHNDLPNGVVQPQPQEAVVVYAKDGVFFSSDSRLYAAFREEGFSPFIVPLLEHFSCLEGVECSSCSRTRLPPVHYRRDSDGAFAYVAIKLPTDGDPPPDSCPRQALRQLQEYLDHPETPPEAAKLISCSLQEGENLLEGTGFDHWPLTENVKTVLYYGLHL